MQDLIQDGFIIDVSGTSRGKLNNRIYHLLSNNGKHYICNPNSDKAHEIHSVEEIKSLQNSAITRINVKFKKGQQNIIKALSIPQNFVSKTAISHILQNLASDNENTDS